VVLETIRRALYPRKEISTYKGDFAKRIAGSKTKGFADRQIAHMMRCLESQVHTLRMTMNINRVFKLVDTCAAEFKAKHLITTRHLKPK
jgi:carbamoyl-phosphate synthase large subunit